jgi:hypothetical protein
MSNNSTGAKPKESNFAIELQPTNKGPQAKADDLFGENPAQQPEIPKAAPPKEEQNNSDDGFENKFEDRTKKTNKKGKK